MKRSLDALRSGGCALAILGVACAVPATPARHAAATLAEKTLVLAEVDQATPAGVGTASYAVGHSCSAFALDAERVLTAGHCVTERSEVDLRAPSGEITRATLVRFDARLDAALLRPAHPLSRSLWLSLADATPPIGSEVYVYGSSSLGFPAFARGTVAARSGGAFGDALGPMMLTDIDAWHGLSGAPLLDEGGRAVAMGVGWLDLDFTEPSRRSDLLRAAPVEDLRDFVAGRVAAPVRRCASFAAAHRSEPAFAFKGARTLPTSQVLLDFWEESSVTIDVRVARDGVELYADHPLLSPGESSVGLPLAAADVAGAELEVRGPGIARHARFAAVGGPRLLETPVDTSMTVKLDPPRANDHGWRRFHVESVSALDGHVVAVRPLVLDGTTVVGEAPPHVTLESKQSSPLALSFDGLFLARHAGVYDVVLIAGDVPVAQRAITVP